MNSKQIQDLVKDYNQGRLGIGAVVMLPERFFEGTIHRALEYHKQQEFFKELSIYPTLADSDF